MIIIETILLTALLCTAGYATYIDFKTGLIPNKLLIIASLIIIPADVLYYGFFAGDLFITFILNLAVTVILALLLYGYHFWGAGDSKFIMFIVAALPARYYADSVISVPTLTITVYTFAIAFIYLIIESIVLGIKQKNFFAVNKKITVKTITDIVKNYVVSYAYIFLISFAEVMILNSAQINNGYIAPLINFFIIFTIFSFDFFKKWYIVSLVGLADIVLYAVFFSSMENYLPSALNILLIAVVLIFRSLAEKYNYQVIKTSEIKSGTVLTWSAVLQFKGSRVKGLPVYTTEDFRSRISNEEADSIKRWEKSKTGKSEIMIVRKLPFAVFITIGTLVFLVLRRVEA